MPATQHVFIDIDAKPAPAPKPPKQQPPQVDHENRRDYRRLVLKGATIINPGSSEVGCMVRNQHERGAELKVTQGAHVPVHFLLYVPVDGTAYRAEVRWRSDDRIGVQFLGSEPKPRRHYG